MSLTNERISVIKSSVANICDLLNVAEQQHFLQNCMSPDVFQECIAGATNVIRVQILCKKMINEILTGSTKMYDALCQFFMERSEAYTCMYQRFIAIGSTSGGSSSISSQSDVLFLEEKIKCLNQELLHLHQSHTSAYCKSELFAIEELQTETEAANVVDVDNRANLNRALMNTMKVEMQDFEAAVDAPPLIGSELSQCQLDTNHCITKEVEVVDWSENRNCQNASDEISESMEVNKLDRHSKMKIRSKIVRGRRMFTCECCEKKFKQRKRLESHVRVHTKEMPFSCKNCGMKFAHQTTLVRHVRTHSVEKPFTCENCRRTFGRKSSLVDHVRLHTGEKPFACEQCGETFRIKSGLLRHTRVKHSTATRVGSPEL